MNEILSFFLIIFFGTEFVLGAITVAAIALYIRSSDEAKKSLQEKMIIDGKDICPAELIGTICKVICVFGVIAMLLCSVLGLYALAITSVLIAVGLNLLFINKRSELKV